MMTNRTSTRPPGARRRPVGAGLLAVVAAATLALGACGDGNGNGNGDGATDTAGTASASAVCEDLTALQGHASEMARLGPSSSVIDIEDLRGDMSDDLDDVRESAGESTGPKVDTTRLDQTFARLDEAVTRLDDDQMRGPAALDQIRQPLSALTSAITETRRSAGC